MATIYSKNPAKTRTTMIDGAQKATEKRTKVPGSGRKASGAEGRTVNFPVTVSPTVEAYLRYEFPVDETGAKPKPSSRGYQVEMAVRELMELRILKMRLIAGGMDPDAVIS